MDNSPQSGVSTDKKVSRELVHARTRELAAQDGRDPTDVSQADYEQAKLELTGERDGDRQQEILDVVSEVQSWNPVPGSIGSRARESPMEDEDDEGRNEAAQLVDQGIDQAEREQIHEAGRGTAKTDERRS